MFLGYNNTSHIVKIIENTLNSSILWINLKDIDNYLEKENLSIDNIPITQDYFTYISKQKILLMYNNTFLAESNNQIFAFSKCRYSEVLRVDSIRIDVPNSTWELMSQSSKYLIRLHNAISLRKTSDEDMIARLVRIISQGASV